MKLTDLTLLNNATNNAKSGAFLAMRGKQNAQFPGQSLWPHATLDQIREMIRAQKRLKGFTLSFGAGNVEQYNIPLSGTAQMLLGLNILTLSGNVSDPANYPREMTLTINNELVIENVHGASLSQLFQNDEYYFIPRPLSGQDVITLTGLSPVAREVAVTFYYL